MSGGPIANAAATQRQAPPRDQFGRFIKPDGSADMEAAARAAKDQPDVEPTFKLDFGRDADGTVYGVAGGKSEILTVTTDAQGLPLEEKREPVGRIDGAGRPTVTAVGSTPVLLDSSGTVLAPGGVRARRAASGLPSLLMDRIPINRRRRCPRPWSRG